MLLAFDLACCGLEEHPSDAGLRYGAVLALARAGSTDEAARQFDRFDLASVESEDAAALAARIKKDRALNAETGDRPLLAREAAEAYRRVGSRTRGYFPTVNAATLSLVAGDISLARAFAAEALELVASSGDTGYFATATQAESHLLLGDVVHARLALHRIAELHSSDYGALSTTRRQLRLVCDLTGADPEILDPLVGPAVAHFCGHLIAAPGKAGRFPSHSEGAVAERIAEVVRGQRVGFAYGSLASGGDILWAEALLGNDCELHIVLPFVLDEFVIRSVAPAGPTWVDRFRTCLEAASSVTYATEDAYLGDDVLYAYCARYAMGLALLRARYLDAEASQLAVWDGVSSTATAGTAADVEAWRATGRPVMVVPPVAADGRGGSAPRSTPSSPTSRPDRPGRVVRAMLFGDTRGFSKLSESQLPTFARVVLGTFARVLVGYAAEVEYRNTWGDALYVVLSNATSAANCALDIQAAMATLDLEAEGLPSSLAFRLSGHVGPTFPIHDPVLDTQSFMGSHVSRTARIEPVTPPGSVYVTEAFAASLELSECAEIRCDYVGHLPAAKDYGRLRMYRLSR